MEWTAKALHDATKQIEKSIEQSPTLQAKFEQTHKLPFSNVLNENGHSIVDIVFEGGGMHGVAFAGYCFVLEHFGIRFRSVAGTSAGAISAILLAALSGDETGAKSKQMLEVLDKADFYAFVDGIPNKRGFANRTVTQMAVSSVNNGELDKLKEKSLLSKIWWALVRFTTLRKLKNNIIKRFGLSVGDPFEAWIKEALLTHNVDSLAKYKQLVSERAERENWFVWQDGKFSPLPKAKQTGQLKVITSDITTSSKVIFPEASPLYFPGADEKVCLSQFARASMAIPFFFTPVQTQPSSNIEDWQKYAGLSAKDFPFETPPQDVFFIDGGLISNFPFDVLHAPPPVVPNMPTLGVKLRVDFRVNNLNDFGEFIGGIISTARKAIDNQYSKRYVDEYNTLVKEVPIPKDISWLDLEMSNQDKGRLFASGVDAALAFLESFDWLAYRQQYRGAETNKMPTKTSLSKLLKNKT
jgi:NTE family protein